MYHTLKVRHVERLTPKSVALTFEVPENLSEKFRYQAGQYLSLEETIDGELVRRSYSICSAPSEGILQVGIKQVPNGRFSTYTNQKITAGSILSVAQPEGRFVLNTPQENHSYAGIAAGSGITPILAIAKEVLRANTTSTFYLVYANKTVDDEMFKNQIDHLISDHSDRFVVIRTYSQHPVEGHAFGRIGAALLESLSEVGGLQSEQFFLCGPEGMIEMTSAFLQEKGIAKEAILYELFTASASAPSETVTPNGNYTLQLTCDSVTTELQGGEGQSILDVALQNKIDVPYSCQGGVCSSCIARVIKGSAAMNSNQILTDGEIEEGLVLCCQAHPTTPDIAVDFDDV
jgi:ring-1,2-phenylacetyl-CoA epoxidase subunit PaaE